MDKIATENLFLLEFLVDSVNLDPQCECNAPAGETCVSFQFLDNAPLDVCEADFSPKRNIRNDTEAIKSGKSCLFSLSPSQANSALEQFDISVTVCKRMQPGWLPEKVEIGAALISIANLFNDLISSVEVSDGSTPTAKTLKDIFDINDAGGEIIGKISVYIRMSCFGKLIVTQFQMNLDDKSVLFKDKEGKSLYRYKKAKGKGNKGGCTTRNTTPRDYNANCPTGPCEDQSPPQMVNNQACPTYPCGGQQAGMPMQPQNLGMVGQQLPVRVTPCNECGELTLAPCIPNQQPMGGFQGGVTPCAECGNIPNAPCLPGQAPQAMAAGMGFPQGNSPCLECANVPNAPCVTREDPEGNYQEIGACVGLNSLVVRVHKDNRVERIDPVTGQPLDGDGCGCGNMTPATGFAMGPDLKQAGDKPFSFRMSQAGGGGGGGGGGSIVVNPPVCTAADGAQFTEFSDPNKERFILRIGKKREGQDKKNNIELELCTPKGKDLKPPPQMQTRDTQWDPEMEAAGGGGGGKKGKGGKGAKGGKGKKGKKK